MAFRTPAVGLPNWREMDTQIDRAIEAAKEFRTATVATLPDPATFVGLLRVTDEVGGDTLAWSDGTNFRRMTDNAVVS